MAPFLSFSAPASFPHHGRVRVSNAFTLVELLTVMAVIAILAAIVSPLVPKLLQGNQMNSNITTLSGILEQARESALSQSTHVWVAFTDPPLSNPASGTWVAVFKSIDGTEAAATSGPSSGTSPLLSTVTIPSGNLAVAAKLQNLPGAKYVNYKTGSPIFSSLPPLLVSAAGIPFPASTVGDLAVIPANTWTFGPMQSAGVGTVYFTHAIEFTPDGEAHTQPSTSTTAWSPNVEFGLTPVNGSNADSVIFNISRLTGKTTSIRP